MYFDRYRKHFNEFGEKEFEIFINLVCNYKHRKGLGEKHNDIAYWPQKGEDLLAARSLELKEYLTCINRRWMLWVKYYPRRGWDNDGPVCVLTKKALEEFAQVSD